MGSLGRASVLLVLALAMSMLLGVRPAYAAKVIPPGKEDLLLSMLEPFAIGELVSEGFVLRSMQIDRDRVALSLRDEAGDREATLTLRPRELEDPRASESFSFEFTGDEAAEAAADAIAASIRARDHGGVYVSLEDPRDDPSEGDPAGSRSTADVAMDDPAGQGAWSTMARAGYLAKVAVLAALFFGLALAWRITTRERLRWGSEALAGAAMVAAMVATAAYAWTCDDATISMRYAWNLAQGRGLVFNVGERVQGFTNPLWTLGLSLGAMVDAHLIWAMAMGLACTAGMLVGLWSCLRQLELRDDARWFVLTLVLLFGSQPFLAFSTSGLENPATHLLVAACLAAALRERTGWVMVAAALALLNRLDTAPLLGPLVAWSWWRAGATTRARWQACWPGLVFGAALLGAWLIFATLYYGYPLPNTWYAKGGLHARMGLRYLGDFIARRPSSALVLLGGPIATLVWSRIPALRAAAIACLLQLAYVVAVGGDYMHGRFFTAALIPASLGLVAVLASLGLARRTTITLATALALATLINLARAQPNPTEGVFVIERDPEFSVWARGPVEVVPPESGLAEEGVAISNHLIGQVFGSDPRIQWIDGYGLTDPYVARCPGSEAEPRPGHAQRLIPSAYLRARGDVRQLREGRARLDANDPSLGPELDQLRASPGWADEDQRILYEELDLLTRGPIFDPDRLRLIPRYVFARHALQRVDPRDTFDVLAPD